MKTITMTVDALGQVTAEDLKLGRVGEHKNTRLLVTVDADFAQGIDYYRMSFGGFETSELQMSGGVLSYDVPCAATGTTVKSWQLTGYKAGNAEPELVRKSQICIFTLEPSVEGENDLHEQYSESIESDIIRAKAALAEVERMRDSFVSSEAGKGLSSNDYTDADKAMVEATAKELETTAEQLETTTKALEKLTGGKDVYPAADAKIIGGIIYPTADGSAEYVGGILEESAVEFTLTVGGACVLGVDIYYITFTNRALCLSVNGVQTHTLTCLGNYSDWDQTVGMVSAQVELAAGENILRLDNPNGLAPNLVRIEVENGATVFTKADKSKLDGLSAFCKGRVETLTDMNTLMEDGLYAVSTSVSQELTGYVHPTILIVLKESGSATPGVPAQYVIGGPKTYYRTRNAGDTAWNAWVDVSTLTPEA